VVLTPRVPAVNFNPRGPIENDVLLFPMFHRSPGAILMLRRNRNKPIELTDSRSVAYRLPLSPRPFATACYQPGVASGTMQRDPD